MINNHDLYFRFNLIQCEKGFKHCTSTAITMLFGPTWSDNWYTQYTRMVTSASTKYWKQFSAWGSTDLNQCNKHLIKQMPWCQCLQQVMNIVIFARDSGGVLEPKQKLHSGFHPWRVSSSCDCTCAEATSGYPSSWQEILCKTTHTTHFSWDSSLFFVVVFWGGRWVYWINTCVNMSPHQLDTIFWSKQLNHGVNVSVTLVWSAVFLFLGKQSLFVRLLSLGLFQQEHRSLHEGKALPDDQQDSLCILKAHKGWSLCNGNNLMWYQRTFSEIALFFGWFHP